MSRGELHVDSELNRPPSPAIRTAAHHLISGLSDNDAAALSDRESTLTYAELWRHTQATASGLRNQGLQAGDRVAIYLDKRVENVVAMFAVSAARGVFVPINPVLRAPQVRHILNDCDVKVLVTTAARLKALQEIWSELKYLEQVIVVGELPAVSPEDVQVHRWDALNDVAAAATGPDPIDSDIAAILYTSGSTGMPKGVVLTHRNLIVGAESVSSYLGNDHNDVILAALPLSFDAGLSQVTTGFAAGAHVVLHDYLLPRDLVRACERFEVTGLTGVPPMWLQVVTANWPEQVAGRLRYFANTGGRMPQATLTKLRSLFPNADPYLMYGLTEAFRSTYLPPDQVDQRPDSIGKAIPNAEIMVVRPDGSRCAPGEEGELVHRGALVAQGYWNDPERTAERFRPAPGTLPGVVNPELAVWSGDRVVSDEDGFLFFVGRTDDMIKSSGYRISPTELEEAAYSTGLVVDAVALGLPDEGLGHRVVMAATPVAGVAGDDLAGLLTKKLRQQLPLYMVPSQVVVMESLPRSPNGKFDRVRIREEIT